MQNCRHKSKDIELNYIEYAKAPTPAKAIVIDQNAKCVLDKIPKEVSDGAADRNSFLIMLKY